MMEVNAGTKRSSRNLQPFCTKSVNWGLELSEGENAVVSGADNNTIRMTSSASKFLTFLSPSILA